MTHATRWRLARRSCQLLVLVGLLLIPSLSRYQALREQSDEVGISQEPGPRLVHLALAEVRDPSPYTTALRGSVWTFRAGPLVVSDPLAGAEFLAASRDLLDPFLLTILLPVLATLLLGRVFCGWICPADLFFELGSRLRAFAGVETDVHFSRRTGLAVLALGLAASAWLGSQTLPELYPPRLISGELYGWVWYQRVGVGAWFLLTVLAFEVFVSRRFWCRYVCPGGALYTLLSSRRWLRLRVERSACDGCGDCLPVCELGLKPMARDAGPACNACGDCLGACPTEALSMGTERISV